MNVLRGLPRAPGVQRLARLLGFTTPLRRRTLPQHCMVPVRSLCTARRGTLRLHAVRLRTRIAPAPLRALLRVWRNEEPASHHIVVAIEPHGRRIAIGCDPLHDGMRHIVLEPAGIRHVDIEIVRDVIAATRDDGTGTALGIMRALDRRALSDRFFRDVRAVRDRVASAWVGIPADAARDRDALALLLLSRLMFLYFVQERGLLCGERDYLQSLFFSWQRKPSSGTFYRSVIRALFFGVLNRRPERRSARALALGDLPYLNGGLFEQHRLEHAHPALDLADGAVATIFGSLLERYRFTASDSATDSSRGAGDGIDPELLGQIFEGLMPGDLRGRTGTFYTPSATVDSLVVDTISLHVATHSGVPAESISLLLTGEASPLSDHEVREVARTATGVRVLDPACGSGAFLLSALSHLERLINERRGECGNDTRHHLVAHSLHGVDVLDDAALICSLRLWLALIPQCSEPGAVVPLPNLDRCIRQGDSLVDPLDTRTTAMAPSSSRALRAIVRQLEPAHLEYLRSSPEERSALRQRIRRLEAGLARAWTEVLTRRLRDERIELTAAIEERDLFGDPTSAATLARTRLPAVSRRLDFLQTMQADIAASRALPFFSFPVHFPQAADGFDIVLSNPPWVRAHAWPADTARLLRERYRVCSEAGWPWAARLTRTPAGASAQVDLAFLFLERCVSLLKGRGTLGIVLPAKLLRSLSPGGARAMLLDTAHVMSIEDHSLDQRAIFDADAFTTTVTACRSVGVEPPAQVSVRMTRTGAADLRFQVQRRDLPLRCGDRRAPWLLAPPDCADAVRTMQRNGTGLGEIGLNVRRGAMTSANQHMLITSMRPRLGDLVEITTLAGARGVVEEQTIRPVVRGTDVRAWSCTPAHHVLWSPRNEDPRAATPRRFAAFVRRHLPRGSDGRLQRISPGLFGFKVLWSDLAPDLRVVCAGAARMNGVDVPLIPLNTVYFVPTTDARTAMILSALLNSLPLRTFARAIAERAKDAHFRFFAWTVAMLPLPRGWSSGHLADQLLDISRTAHDRRVLTADDAARIDAMVADAFGLIPAQLRAIHHFDRWLKGET